MLQNQLPEQEKQKEIPAGTLQGWRLDLYNFTYAFSLSDQTGGKRFARYVKKAKTYITEHYLKLFNIPCGDGPVTMEDLMVMFFEDYFRWDGRNPENQPSVQKYMYDSIRRYAAPQSGIATENDEWKLEAVRHPHDSIAGSIPVYDLIEYETALACRYFIRNKAVWQNATAERITEKNYFLTLPDTPCEAALLYEEILNAVYFDIELMARTPAARDMTKNPDLAQQVQNLQDKLDEKENEAESLKKQLAEAEAKLQEKKDRQSDLDKWKKKAESADGQAQMLADRCTFLERMNQKLVEAHNAMAARHAKMVEDAAGEELCDEEGKEEEAYREVDPKGRYIFFADENTAFRNNLLAEFPNAQFYKTAVSLKGLKADIVVVITSHVKHSSYYKLKQQCKELGIPFIQCRYTNTGMIKEQMWEIVNFGRNQSYRNSAGPQD